MECLFAILAAVCHRTCFPAFSGHDSDHIFLSSWGLPWTGHDSHQFCCHIAHVMQWLPKPRNRDLTTARDLGSGCEETAAGPWTFHENTLNWMQQKLTICNCSICKDLKNASVACKTHPIHWARISLASGAVCLLEFAPEHCRWRSPKTDNFCAFYAPVKKWWPHFALRTTGIYVGYQNPTFESRDISDHSTMLSASCWWDIEACLSTSTWNEIDKFAQICSNLSVSMRIKWSCNSLDTIVLLFESNYHLYSNSCCGLLWNFMNVRPKCEQELLVLSC